MRIPDKIDMENYFINNSIKFYIKPKKIRDFFVAGIELLKIILAKLKILRWSFNERIIERPFVFQNLPKKGRILDIGCSDSIMPIEIASLGYETYGNDLKKYPYRYPGFKFIQGDAFKLDFPDNYFDAITCISTLEHVGLSKDFSGNTGKRKDKLLIEKIRKMLKKKGILMLTIPFGARRILENKYTRIYDSEECRWLFSGFRRIKQRYFYQKGEIWEETSPEFLEKLTTNKFEETVALFILRKI